MRVFFASFVFSCALLGASAIDISGCTPAQQAVFKQVEDTILNLLTSHATLEAVEAAVAALVPDGTDVDLAITTAIDYLHSIGALPPDVWPTAQAMQTVIAGKAHFVKGATK